MGTRAKSARLLVLTGGRRLEIALADRVTIGRASECDVVLDDSFASRVHAEIRREADGYALFDLGSTNGTLVGGRAIRTRRALRHGDEIQVGESLARYIEEGQQDARTRRHKRATEESAQCLVQVDLEAWQVSVEGKQIEKLAPQEFRFLALLYGKSGDVCRREEICYDLWGDERAYDLLHELVYRVKRRIEPEPRKPRYLITVRGIGYKLALRQSKSV